MPRFRSRISVNTYSQPQFAQTSKPSTLLQCYGTGSLGPGGRRRYHDGRVSLRKFRRRSSKAKVRSGMEAVDATTGFASGMLSTLFQLALGTGVGPLPVMVYKRFRSERQGGRRKDAPLYEQRQTPQPPSTKTTQKTKSYDIKRYTTRKRPLQETQQKQYHLHHASNTRDQVTNSTNNNVSKG